MHPRYSGYHTVFADVAVIKLAEKIPFSATAQPIKLSSSDPLPNESLSISGYGESPSFPDRELYRGDTSAISFEDCMDALSFTNRLKEGMICVRAGTPNTCTGDSGGPVVNSRRELVGLVSWGYKCDNSAHPSVFTSVSHYREFIEEKMKA